MVDSITENGLLLGIMPAALYTTREQDLRSGDRFLLYTDGFKEATNHCGDFYGDERLGRVC